MKQIERGTRVIINSEAMSKQDRPVPLGSFGIYNAAISGGVPYPHSVEWEGDYLVLRDEEIEVA